MLVCPWVIHVSPISLIPLQIGLFHRHLLSEIIESYSLLESRRATSVVVCIRSLADYIPRLVHSLVLLQIILLRDAVRLSAPFGRLSTRLLLYIHCSSSLLIFIFQLCSYELFNLTSDWVLVFIFFGRPLVYDVHHFK